MPAHIRRVRADGTRPRAQPSESPQTRELRRYFEYSRHGADTLDDGLKEITFGEYLVEAQVLDRYQLFRALQLQDRTPGARLGECAAALGYAPIAAIERLYERFAKLAIVEVPGMVTLG